MSDLLWKGGLPEKSKRELYAYPLQETSEYSWKV